MKKIIRNATVAVALCLAMASCQKEYLEVTPSLPINQTTNIIDANSITYTVDGELYSTPVYNDSTYKSVVDMLFALAEEGKEVTFFYGNAPNTCIAKKETVTFTTSDKNEAVQWATTMSHDGYTVNINYDPRNHIYICTATR